MELDTKAEIFKDFHFLSGPEVPECCLCGKELF